MFPFFSTFQFQWMHKFSSFLKWSGLVVSILGWNISNTKQVTPAFPCSLFLVKFDWVFWISCWKFFSGKLGKFIFRRYSMFLYPLFEFSVRRYILKKMLFCSTKIIPSCPSFVFVKSGWTLCIAKWKFFSVKLGKFFLILYSLLLYPLFEFLVWWRILKTIWFFSNNVSPSFPCSTCSEESMWIFWIVWR